MGRNARWLVAVGAGALLGFWLAFAVAPGVQAQVTAACRGDDDCKAPRQCDQGRCVDPAPRPPPEASPLSGNACRSDADCKGASVCERGACADPLNPNARPMAPSQPPPNRARVESPLPPSQPQRTETPAPPSPPPRRADNPASSAAAPAPLLRERTAESTPSLVSDAAAALPPRVDPAPGPRRAPPPGQRFIAPNILSPRRLSGPAAGAP